MSVTFDYVDLKEKNRFIKQTGWSRKLLGGGEIRGKRNMKMIMCYVPTPLDFSYDTNKSLDSFLVPKR